MDEKNGRGEAKESLEEFIDGLGIVPEARDRIVGMLSGATKDGYEGHIRLLRDLEQQRQDAKKDVHTVLCQIRDNGWWKMDEYYADCPELKKLAKGDFLSFVKGAFDEDILQEYLEVEKSKKN